MSTLQTVGMLIFMVVVASAAVILVLAAVILSVFGMVGQAVLAAGMASVTVGIGYRVASWADSIEY